MGRQGLDLSGYESDGLKVIREAPADEVPRYAKKQKYWVVECKRCGRLRTLKSSVVRTVKACAKCHNAMMHANTEQRLRDEALSAWSSIEKAASEHDLDAIERAVKVLRWYEKSVSDSK
jgi:hypothetical protein